MFEAIKKHIARFRKDDTGTVAIEGIIVLPLLFWSLLAMYAFFDAYRQAGNNIKAAYTIGDLLSRETNFINAGYLDTTYALFNLMTDSKNKAKMRISVVKWDENQKKYKLDWSRTRGGVTALSNNGVSALKDQLPTMPHNERVILVETWARYHPPFKVGIEEQDFYNLIFTRPRFAPQLLYSEN